MKVIVDARVYSDAPQGGTFRVFNEILPRLSKFSNLDLRIFAPHTAQQIQASTGLSVASEPLSIPIITKSLPEGTLKNQLKALKAKLRPLWLQFKLGGIKNAVFHSTTYNQCPWKQIPEVVTIHDMISEIFPELQREPHLIRQRSDKLQSIRQANRLIAISECTKQDLVKFYQIPEGYIDVIPHGVDLDFFGKKLAQDETNTHLIKLNIQAPYILYIGGRVNHKNFKRFAEAYASSTSLIKQTLVLVGGGPLTKGELELLHTLEIDLHYNHILKATETELRVLYQKAQFFTFPSYYEGFGLPLIEAMAAGCPVAASKAGPFPEIGGDAVQYFDPYSITDIARQMESLLNPLLAEECRRKGQIRAQSFNWDKAANLYFKTYQRALEEPRKLKDVVSMLSRTNGMSP